MFVGQTERLARGIDEFRAAFAVRLGCAGDFGNAFADQRLRDDELRLARRLLRRLERFEERPPCRGRRRLHVPADRLRSFARASSLCVLSAIASSVTSFES